MITDSTPNDVQPSWVGLVNRSKVRSQSLMIIKLSVRCTYHLLLDRCNQPLEQAASPRCKISLLKTLKNFGSNVTKNYLWRVNKFFVFYVSLMSYRKLHNWTPVVIDLNRRSSLKETSYILVVIKSNKQVGAQLRQAQLQLCRAQLKTRGG